MTPFTHFFTQFFSAAICQTIEQPDPCKIKSRVIGDIQYCDRYWECEDREPQLYDCPNGLVWVGKDRGIADGCDYPWRNPTLCRNKDLASKSVRVVGKRYAEQPTPQW